MAKLITEALAAATVTPAGGGRYRVQLIDAGEGSSGHYSAEVLQQAATDRIFEAGTHMYLDHAGMLGREIKAAGGRSVRDLAAVLDSDAVYNAETQALEATAKVFAANASELSEIAPHIGVSISAMAEVGPPPKGSTKPTVERITAAESVDFVVAAGRGGRVLEILESAQAMEAATDDRRDQLRRCLDALPPTFDPQGDRLGAWVDDFDDVQRTVWYRRGRALWQQAYTVADDDQSVTLTGDPTEVRSVTTYVPVAPVGVSLTTTESKEAPTMPEIPQERLDALLEAEAQSKTLLERAQKAEAAVAERDAADKVAAAKAEAAKRVTAATEGMRPEMVTRITTEVTRTITEADLPADIDQQIATAIEAETKYLAGLTEGRLTGFGESKPVTESTPTRTHNAWGQPIKEA